MRTDDDADPQRRHFERMRRSAALPKPEDGYGQHEAAWQHCERMRRTRPTTWRPFDALWKAVTDGRG